MANISGYLANIKSASRGEDVRDSIINALNAINLDNPAVIKPLNVTANGTYAGQGGIVYNPVTVNVPEGTSNAIALKSIKITENGETEADDGEAFSSVEVDVPQYTNEILEEVTFTQNGDYDALLDGYDGYGLVHVNVQQGGTGSYTVKFFAADRTTVLQTVVGVPAGGGAAYTAGPNPTSSGMRFVGWTPNPLQIYADTNCYPRFENLIWDETQIQDDWITIAKNVRTNPDAYNIGQWKLLELKHVRNDDVPAENFGYAYYAKMQLVGKGVDPLEGENGYAPTSWVAMNTIPHLGYASGASTSGWHTWNVKLSFLEDIMTKYIFPQDLLKYVRKVIKYTCERDGDSGIFFEDYTSINWFWIPSFREVFGNSSEDWNSYTVDVGNETPFTMDNHPYENLGPVYDIFGSGSCAEIGQKAIRQNCTFDDLTKIWPLRSNNKRYWVYYITGAWRNNSHAINAVDNPTQPLASANSGGFNGSNKNTDQIVLGFCL